MRSNLPNSFPFEFTAIGTPVSQQCRRRSVLRDWKRDVLAQAQARNRNRKPVRARVIVNITYYYLDHGIDLDNLAKPICDALKGFVYDDDNQITDLISRKRDLNGTLTISTVSSELGEALQKGEEFIHVTVDVSPIEGRAE
jgi:crossover junction endodeoxyribonuclease RusA